MIEQVVKSGKHRRFKVNAKLHLMQTWFDVTNNQFREAMKMMFGCMNLIFLSQVKLLQGHCVGIG